MKKKIVVLSIGCLLGVAVVLSACVPSIPHVVDGRKDCISCHGESGVKPYPAWHVERKFDNNRCADCHKVKSGATSGSDSDTTSGAHS